MRLVRTAECGSLRAADIGREVVVAGWVARRRDHGNLIFIDVRDRSGICQVVFRPETAAAAHEAAGKLRIEYVVAVAGVITGRGVENVNPNLPSGEVEIVASDLELLNESEPAPFPIDDAATPSEETRLRYRYLDLRRPALQRTIAMRHRLAMEARRVLDAEGFLEIETPILTKSTPEGARDYLVPSRIQPGSFYALPQSPQLFKQILMIAGFERYYQLARCFRDEDLRADRQPEFTQIDVEMSFVAREDVMKVVERVMEGLCAVAGMEASTPFPRMTWSEAMERYGTDRPDTRFGLELVDVTARAGGGGFAPFDGAIESGGAVLAIRVPGASGYSRRQLDDLAARAKQSGARTLVWIKSDAGGVTSPAAKQLGVERCGEIATAAGAGEGDLVLIVPGDRDPSRRALGVLRLEIAGAAGLVPPGRHDFLWVTDFPLFERDVEEDRWVACHHPFTSPLPGDLDRLESDPAGVRAAAYDLVLDGTEIAGGSIRIHRPDVQQRIFSLLGMSAAEAESRFGFFLRALRMGAPPHGGIAFGFDRIVAILCGHDSIREVIAFPKTASATCLMTESPSPVDARQLRELGIRIAD